MFLKVYLSAKSWFLKYKQGLLHGLHNENWYVYQNTWYNIPEDCNLAATAINYLLIYIFLGYLMHINNCKHHQR